MRYGIDALALAKYKDVIVRYMPKGFGLGVFALVDGFGDGLAALQEVLVKRPDIPFVRVQLMWKDRHDFSSRDYPFVQRQAERLLPIIQRNLQRDWYVSPCCEDRLNEVEWRKFAGITSTALASVPFHLVHSPEKPKRFSNVINEYHHASGGDAFSYDGANAFDSDVEKDKAAYKTAPYFMFWNCQFNGRKTLKDTTPRPRRKAYPIREHVESIAAISGSRGRISTTIRTLIGKSHSDQHDDKPEGKDCKPVYITPLNVSPNRLELKRNGRVISTSSVRMPYNEKKPDGSTGKQIGWRYYFPKWGYQISTSPLDLWGGRKRIAICNPAFRCFNYR